jgi:hypothetical protein
MSRSRNRPSSSFSGSGILSLALALIACRAGSAPKAATPSHPPAPSAEASATSEATATAAPTASPPLAPPIAPPVPPPSAGSSKVTLKSDPAWGACHHDPGAKKKDVSADVEAMARACAKVTRMSLVGKTLTGKQGDQDPPQTFPLAVEAGRCYRVYAQGSDGIKDLDLAIKDSTGAVAGEDATDNSSPVVVEDGAVCFKEADSAAVVVSVGLGKGNYAVQIWKD